MFVELNALRENTVQTAVGFSFTFIHLLDCSIRLNEERQIEAPGVYMCVCVWLVVELVEARRSLAP